MRRIVGCEGKTAVSKGWDLAVYIRSKQTHVIGLPILVDYFSR